MGVVGSAISLSYLMNGCLVGGLVVCAVTLSYSMNGCFIACQPKLAYEMPKSVFF